MATKWIQKRKAVMAVVLSLLFSVMQVTGYQISMHLGTSVHQSDFFQKIGVLSVPQCMGVAVAAFAFWCAVIYGLFTLLEKARTFTVELSRKKEVAIWIVVAGLLFLCWFPYFLAAYPGFYNYDAMVQVPQAIYEEVQYSTHHPLLHTLFVGKLIAFGHSLRGNFNDGIVLHSVVQMLVCAVALAYMVVYVLKISGRKWLGALAFLYYAFLPVIPMFALSTTKDTIFSVLLQLTVIWLYEMYRDIPAFMASKWKGLRFVAVAVLMCLFRKNGIYALVCVIPFAVAWGRKYWRQLLLVFATVAILYGVVDKGLSWTLNAVPGSAEEMLSVPMQQLAKVYNEHGEEAFTEEELELIYEGISKEQLLNYNPFLADNIKNYFDYTVITDNKTDYLMLWVNKGLEHPLTYVKAFLYNTYQAWYPATFIYAAPEQSATYYFDMNMHVGAERDTKNQDLLVFCQQIGTEPKYQGIPVVRMLFSIGAMLWVAMFTWFYGIYRKNRALTVAMLLTLFCCATVFLGPVSLVRYYLVLFYGFPVSVGFLLKGK